MKKRNILVFLTLLCSCTLYAQHYRYGPTEKDYVAYLFTYFKGNDVKQEAINYAVSTDGYNYYALNYNEPIIDSKEISSTGGVRDPHILRCEDGRNFYMVVTDMTSSKGWDSNRALILMKSDNLVDWSSTIINIQNKYPNQENLKRVWAPQVIYDQEAQKYMVYWSMQHGNGADIIYYSYANEEFTDFESEPKVLFLPESRNSCIDADIVYKEGLYYMFYKTEGAGNGIKLVTTKSLTSGDWDEKSGYKQKTNHAVEGSSIFKLINSDEYILMYDIYMEGKYQFCKSTDLENFEIIDEKVSMDFKPRHGSIIPITQRELLRITKRWGKPKQLNFTHRYNPVIEGYYSDPATLYSNKTGKYYIYPTSDGFDSWGGYYFKTFSSTNLVDWKDEGVILDLKKDVPWAGRNAWAPCIIERKIGDSYKYYYYFTGAQKIGVAVADDPCGPFIDSGKPIVDFRPEGVEGGQEIDPEVFYDPQSDKYYLYWGNGYAAVAELNDDMVSIKKHTVKVITPDQSFREGISVFCRQGKYYFLWSENDTRDVDYRVRYGTSTSPEGPIEIPDNNLILAKDESKGIYGTGHNCVLKINNKEEWYIVYHRFGYPTSVDMGDAAGFHREVCMDRLEFNSKGEIIKINPSF